MSKSPSRRKKDLRDKKITVAVYHYVHHTTDLASIADTVRVDVETLEAWQKTKKWHGEMNIYTSDLNALCDKLGLDQMPDSQHSEMDGSLTNFAWFWGNLFQEGIEFDEIHTLKRMSGFKMNSENYSNKKPIGIENPFQRLFRLTRIGYQNVRTILSLLF